MLDQRMTDVAERARYLDHWYACFVSARDSLMGCGAVDAVLMAEFEREFDQLRRADNAVFIYSNRQVRARNA